MKNLNGRKYTVLYSPIFWSLDFGRFHPVRPFRVKFFYDLIQELGFISNPFCMREPDEFDEDILLLFHDPAYIDAVRFETRDYVFGLNSFDNPVIPGIFRWAFESVKATVSAIMAAKDGGIAFNPGGGMHHAKPSLASGFCYFNDIVIAIKKLKCLYPDLRIFYIDLDAHHGDGVEEAFYDSSDVLVLSVHQEDIFPLTGSIERLGIGKGYGYNVNIPLPRYSEDEDLWYVAEEIIFPLIEKFAPDILFIQVGADAHKDDPLTNLYFTTGIYKKISQEINRLRKGSIVLTGGGGYDIVNVARIWTIFLLGVTGIDLPERLPEKFLRIAIMEGYDGPFLEDMPGWSGFRSNIKDVIKERVSFLKNNIPLLGG